MRTKRGFQKSVKQCFPQHAKEIIWLVKKCPIEDNWEIDKTIHAINELINGCGVLYLSNNLLCINMKDIFRETIICDTKNFEFACCTIGEAIRRKK